MKVTFVRHGANQFTGTPRLVGRTDVPLSELGRRQAEAVSERLADRPFDALWSSPLQRCADTARAIAARTALQPLFDARLLEVDLGALEGKSFGELPEGQRSFRERWGRRPGTTRFPQGETIAECGARGWKVLEELYDRHPQGHAVVVCHMFAIQAMLARIFQLKPHLFRTFAIDVCSLSTVDMAKGGFRLLQLNDTSHLDALPASPTRTPAALPARTKL
ncbi:MAG: histidine phosphatase family protein [Deltaproteobacteria bacterium]|nr:histidine phosphatase family protein [Deltaproteobacteria bacterium]